MEELKASAVDVQLGTALPTWHQSLQRTLLALTLKASPRKIDEVKDTLVRSMVTMACTSAVQVIIQEDTAAAERFEDAKLKPISVKMTDLPTTVQIKLKEMKDEYIAGLATPLASPAAPSPAASVAAASS